LNHQLVEQPTAQRFGEKNVFEFLPVDPGEEDEADIF